MEAGIDFPILCWAGFYRREALGDNPFRVGMSFGEDVLFNLHFFTSADRTVVLTTSRLYLYEVRADSAIGNRSRSASRRMVECSLTLMDAISAAAVAHPRLADNLRRLMHGQMTPATSRILGSGLSRRDFGRACARLTAAGALPYTGHGAVGRVIAAVYRYRWMYPVFSLVFKRIFEPYILPRIAKG